MRPDPESLLGFWFGHDLDSADSLDERTRLWFAGVADFDDAIRERFSDWPERASAGELEAWRDEARTSLALVLTTDQLPRNLHRGVPRAFAYDSIACEVATRALEAGFDRALHPVEASFFYLPFEHAEDPALQERCVALYSDLVERTSGAACSRIEAFHEYAVVHRDVIRKFGRFPHRNSVLGREPTREEADWLASGGATF